MMMNQPRQCFLMTRITVTFVQLNIQRKIKMKITLLPSSSENSCVLVNGLSRFPPTIYLDLLSSLLLLLLKHKTGALKGSPRAPGSRSSPVSCILCLQGGCEPHPGEQLAWLVLKRLNHHRQVCLAMPLLISGPGSLQLSQA